MQECVWVWERDGPGSIYCPSRALVNLRTPVGFPGSFPRFHPPSLSPFSLLHMTLYPCELWLLIFCSSLHLFSFLPPSPLRAPVLVALALIESGMKYEDAVQFIRQWVPSCFFFFPSMPCTSLNHSIHHHSLLPFFFTDVGFDLTYFRLLCFSRKRRGAFNSRQLFYLEKYRPKMRLRFKDTNGHNCCVQ